MMYVQDQVLKFKVEWENINWVQELFIIQQILHFKDYFNIKEKSFSKKLIGKRRLKSKRKMKLPNYTNKSKQQLKIRGHLINNKLLNNRKNKFKLKLKLKRKERKRKRRRNLHQNQSQFLNGWKEVKNSMRKL